MTKIFEVAKKYWPFIGCGAGAAITAVSKAELERRFKEWKEEFMFNRKGGEK
jgi:hypothetical protein